MEPAIQPSWIAGQAAQWRPKFVKTEFCARIRLGQIGKGAVQYPILFNLDYPNTLTF
jgi:hypothetical protein